MIGYIVDETTATSILDGIDAAMDTRGLPRYWTVGKYYVHTGEHSGSWFLPFDDTMLTTDIYRKMTPMDFPEAVAMVESLGGLEARVDLDPFAILDPSVEVEEEVVEAPHPITP
jgi:hypothetical protein